MSVEVDLRITYGWRLCHHAKQMAQERGVSIREVLEVVAAPERRQTGFNYGEGRWLYVRGDLTVAVDPRTRTVITVLWNIEEEWTSAEFRAHRTKRNHQDGGPELWKGAG